MAAILWQPRSRTGAAARRARSGWLKTKHARWAWWFFGLNHERKSESNLATGFMRETPARIDRATR